MAGAKSLAFWLVPAEPERGFLSTVIHILAEQLHAPEFEPHVTLFSSAAANLHADEIVRGLGAKPLRLRIIGIDYSDTYTRTLFVRFETTPALNKLGDAARRACGGESDYTLDPHLSLVYKELPVDARKALAYDIAIPFEEVTFDVVRAVVCPTLIRRAEDVDAWQVVASRQLR